ncbi:MAG: hypothetical protein IPH32_12150 [Bacteroidetes bacterium]|nr:hypothetical protein [Bacteroidota bacterium]
MATQNGLIKFSPIPYREIQKYLSKTNLDFKQEFIDESGREFYVKKDELNRLFY